MREIRLYGSEGGGAVRSPYPYNVCLPVNSLVTQSIASECEPYYIVDQFECFAFQLAGSGGSED